jgi:predicted nucleic acid-binding protein
MPDSVESDGLVLDTGVWLNLMATEAMGTILDALAVPCYAPEQVETEIRRHPGTRTTFLAGNHPLRQMSPRVSILSLENEELDLFLEIVGAPSRDALGDGEAAAIVVAASRGLDLVIDDRKARRILRERFSQVRTYWTVDLFRASAVVTALGRTQVEEYFTKAVRIGRMHVPRT